jgi:integrase
LWSDFDLDNNVYRVTAAKVRTSLDRWVPIPPNLKVWLEPIIRWTVQERVAEYAKLDRLFVDLAKRAGIKWKRNGLRHSYITYRMAIEKNAAAIATDAGNSPAMINANYRAPALEKDAREWFGILPAKGQLARFYEPNPARQASGT